jgi:hypothetical protein
MKAVRIIVSLLSQWAELPTRLNYGQTGRQLVSDPDVGTVDPHLEGRAALKTSAQCELGI